MINNEPRKVYMKPKVYVLARNGCPFLGGAWTGVICESYADFDLEWYAMATHVCSCMPRKKGET